MNENGTAVLTINNRMSTVALCACSFMNAYLAISVFPYAGYMVMELVGGEITQDSVGAYAGLIASSFMFGRTLSSYAWGMAADVYGRAFVLKSCLFLSSVISLFFGMSTSLTWALIWRFCLGLSNGLISTAKTAATELANQDEAIERRTMGLVIGMRSWGYLLSPAIGGLLADPIKQYPEAAAWMHPSFVSNILTKYRFLLPNLAACVGCFVTFLIVKYFIYETLPESKRRNASNLPRDVLEWIQVKMECCSGKEQYDESRQLLSGGHETTYNQGITLDSPSEPAIIEQVSISSRVVTRRYMLLHWMFSFVSMCADEMFPLFCMSQKGGLGLAESSIGKILSGAGLLFAVSQYAVFASLIHYFGEFTCLTIGSILGIQPATLIPLSLLLDRSPSHPSWSIFCLLSVVMAFCKLFGMLYFASLALALNKTVPVTQRATMNGLVVTGASLTRSIAPTFAGALTTFSFSSVVFPAKYGSLLMYGILSTLGAYVTLRVHRLQEKRVEETTVEMENVEN